MMGTVQWLRSEFDTLPVPGTVKWLRSELDTIPSTVPTVKWLRSEMNTTAVVTPTVKWLRSEMNTTREVALIPFAPITTEPEAPVPLTALLTTGDIADSYTWRVVSVAGFSGSVTFTGTGNTRTFQAPSGMPPAGATVVIGVTATIGGKTSPEQTVTVTVLPQLRWLRVGGSWVGMRPAVALAGA